MSKIFREPLVQFLLLGVLVYCVNVYVFENTENPKKIEIDDARFKALADLYREEQGGAPSPEAMEQMIITWAQNEVMYREALSMGLDRGDAMIRSRMVLKLRDVLFNSVIAEPPPEEELEQWFEENRKNYDRPDIIDFEQFQAIDVRDESVESFAREINSEGLPETLMDRVRKYELRIDDNLHAVFDDSDAQRVIKAPLNTWTPARSDRGWHMVRVTRRLPGEAAEFHRVKTAVLTDWRKQAREAELAEALAEIVSDYDIEYEFSKELLEDSFAPSSDGVASAAD
ncbi:MAG: peptidyl-prolyl cis-trans isomerase [Pseudomonadota bacterium]